MVWCIDPADALSSSLSAVCKCFDAAALLYSRCQCVFMLHLTVLISMMLMTLSS